MCQSVNGLLHTTSKGSGISWPCPASPGHKCRPDLAILFFGRGRGIQEIKLNGNIYNAKFSLHSSAVLPDRVVGLGARARARD